MTKTSETPSRLHIKKKNRLLINMILFLFVRPNTRNLSNEADYCQITVWEERGEGERWRN